MAAEIVTVTTEEQLRTALAIRVKVFVEEQNVPLEEETDQHDRLTGTAHHFLIQDGGETVAAGRVIFYDDETAKMQRIAVLQNHRSKGYGRVLLLAMEERARELGLRYSLLDAQCQVESFYKKLGYVTVSDDPFVDAGIPHVRMHKKL